MSLDTQNILDGIEDDLGITVTSADRTAAVPAVRRGRTFALKSPARRLYEAYQNASSAKRTELFDTWKVRYLRRGDTNAGLDKLTRRFTQYLSFGKRSPVREGKNAGKDTFSLRRGAVSKIQTLLGRDPDDNMPEYLWVTVYATRLRPLSAAAQQFANQDSKAKLMTPMLYIGHRRDSQLVRDRVRISDARRRAGTDNGLTEITKHYLDNGFAFQTDFEFDEYWTVDVLGEVDHGHGLEASNALQASVIEDLKRIEVIEDFLDGTGERPLNAKIDNSLLGVTNIKGLLQRHDTPVSQLDKDRILRKLEPAKRKLTKKYEAYKKRFIKDASGNPVLPVINVTKDGIGQKRTAEFSQTRRRNILRTMEIA